MKNSALLKMMQPFISDKSAAKLEKIPLKRSCYQSASGFTMIELLVVIIIIGVLSAIAAPSWLAFVNRQRVNAVNDAALRAIQEAQLEAKRTKFSYSVSFKTPSGQLPQVAVYRDGTLPTFRNLTENQDIKPQNVVMCSNIDPASAKVNKKATSSSCNLTTQRTITFSYQGNLPIGSDEGLVVTVAVPQVNNPTLPIDATKRCVKVTTLLGAIQTGKETECPL